MFVVIFIPDFSLQSALRCEPDLRQRPVALVDPAAPKPDVVQLTAEARARGVREGLTASQALARCPELLVKRRSPAAEQAATDALLQTAYAFSPDIEATAPGVCTLELNDANFPGDEPAATAWASTLRETLAQFHLDVRIGLAATPALALLAARAANPVLVFSGRDGRAGCPQPAAARSPAPVAEPRRAEDSAPHLPLNPERLLSPSLSSIVDGGEGARLVRRSFSEGGRAGEEALGVQGFNAPIVIGRNPSLESLPIAALEPSPEILDVLERWGIHTVGALLALGADRLAERLGPEALAWFERVSPASIRPLRRVVPPEIFAEQIEFENEIETLEPLLFILRRFVEQLSRRVELNYLVVAELRLRLDLASGAKHESLFQIPSPTANVNTLFRTLHTRLETMHTDAPIVALRLEARPGRAETHQFGLFETTLRDPNRFAETLARLTALCGANRVGAAVVPATHRPDVFQLRAPEFGNVGQASRLSSERPGASKTRAGETPALLCGPPLRRFRPALPARIEFREQRPALLRSAVFNGAIAGARGPFLSSGNWWEPDRWSREEWDVQASDGALYRIFRSPEGCFVEGVYD